jgi:hypothetical protein
MNQGIQSRSESSGLSSGAKVGIAVGVLLGIDVIVVALWLYYRKKKKASAGNAHYDNHGAVMTASTDGRSAAVV